MKHKIEWRKIKIRGLGNYEVSNLGDVRSAFNRHRVDIQIVRGKERYYNLKKSGKEEPFLISELLESTFPLEYLKKDSQIAQKMYPESDQLSQNEDDYGGRGGGEWQEIKEFLEQKRIIHRNGMS